MAEPFSKERQLARGERRYRRKVASPKQWQAIRAEKGETCRLYKINTRIHELPTHYHHLVSRAALGDDVADNLVPLCGLCHTFVTRRSAPHLKQLAAALTDAEYAYVTSKLGEGGMQRLFGV